MKASPSTRKRESKDRAVRYERGRHGPEAVDQQPRHTHTPLVARRPPDCLLAPRSPQLQIILSKLTVSFFATSNSMNVSTNSTPWNFAARLFKGATAPDTSDRARVNFGAKSKTTAPCSAPLRGRYESLKTVGNSEAVMQKEDNDEDKVSIYSSVRFAGSTAGN